MFSEIFVSGLLAVAPALLLCPGFVPRAQALKYPVPMAGAARVLTIFSLLAAIWGAVAVAVAGPISVRLGDSGATYFGIYFDALSATIFALISFLGAIVAQFGRNYLKGDVQEGRFFKWLCVTTGAALALSIAGNLVLFTLAWMAMSLSLHQLLTLYRDRPNAVLAARKKFIISRLGDLCLLGVLFLSYRVFGSWDFETIFAAAKNLAGAPVLPSEITWIALLLVCGAMLKSAQFPFHSWLPETMEAPTPVSAIMHAGIVNAGGFLIIRLSPLVSLVPTALDILAIVGALTAALAAIVMTTQTSVKRSLAFSTVAQMGFMMLQCGLGAFGVATLHIVAHSLYKAHAFLGSGSVVAPAKGELSLPKNALSAPAKIAAFSLALGITLSVGALFGITISKEPGAILLGAVLVLALTGLLLNIWKVMLSPFAVGVGTLLVASVSAAYFSLHLLFHGYLKSVLPAPRAALSATELGILGLGAALFLVVWGASQIGSSEKIDRLRRAFYVHAANGFYLHTYANRLISRF